MFNRKAQLKVQIVTRAVTDLRLAEWQADAELTKHARKLHSDSTFQMMMAVLRNEHPAFLVAGHDACSLEGRAILQARAEGYSMAIANLEAMGRHQLIKPVPEATFEPEEEQQ